MIKRWPSRVAAVLLGTAMVLGAGVVVPTGLSVAAAASVNNVSVPGTTILNGVACLSPTTCLAVGFGPSEGVVVPITSGAPGSVTDVASTASLEAVACPTATTCVAVGSNSSNAGVAVLVANETPSTPIAVSGTVELNGVACPTPSTCVAVGESTSSTGIVVPLVIQGSALTAGSSVSVPGTVVFNALSCPDAADCVAVGGSAFVALTLGTGSSPSVSVGAITASSGSEDLESIACTSATTCLGTGFGMTTLYATQVGTTATYVSFSGAGSSQQVAGTSVLSGVACPTTMSCTEVGMSSTEGPAVITTATLLSGTATSPIYDNAVDQFNAVACQSPSSCLAVGHNGVFEGIVATIPGPVSGGPPGPSTVTPGSPGVEGIACPRPSQFCLGVGAGPATVGEGVVVETLDGFVYPAEPIAGTENLSGISCLSAFVCVAVGQSSSTGTVVVAAPSPDGIPSTQTALSVTGTETLSDISCDTNADICLAVGTNSSNIGVVVPINFQLVSGSLVASAGAIVTVPGTSFLYAVACQFSASSCLATGNTSSNIGIVVPIGLSGGAATAGTVLDVPATTSLSTVACPSTGGACLAGGPGQSTNSVLVPVAATGTSTSVVVGAASTVTNATDIYGLSCPGGTNCEAVGDNDSSEGVVFPVGLSGTSGGASSTLVSVGAVATVAGSSQLLALACVSTTSCETAGTESYNVFAGGTAGLLAPAVPATVPGMPTGLTATPGNSQVSLSWVAPSSDGGLAVTGYDIYQGTAAGQEATTPVNPSLVTGNSYTVDNLSNGTSYYFTVEAVNDVGNGPESAEVSATPAAPQLTTTTAQSTTTTTAPNPATTTTTAQSTTTTTAPNPATTTTTAQSTITTTAPNPATTTTIAQSTTTTTAPNPATTTTPVLSTTPKPPAHPSTTSNSRQPTLSGAEPTSGPPSGGTKVEVVGHHLCSVSEVLFGNARALNVRANKSCTALIATAPPGHGTVQVRLLGAGGRLVTAPETYTYAGPGFLMVTKSGAVKAIGSARTYGAMPAHHAPVVAIAEAPNRQGYWLFTSTGEVYGFGDARPYGSVPQVLDREHKHLAAPVVAAEATPDGKGYRLFAADGGVFDFGDARFLGSLPSLSLVPREPVSGGAFAMVAVSDPVGQGYWLVSADGAVYTFGDAHFHGSLGARRLRSPIIGMVATPDGNGYWLVSANGAVYSFGDAPRISSPASKVASRIVTVP
jgi:hypothetical protein